MKLSRELAIAEALARHAGQMALDLQHDSTFTYKPNSEGPVTNADIAIDRYIVHELLKEFPKDSIISEESFTNNQTPLTRNRTWFVDPIDGTSSYMVGGDDFVIMIGLVIDGAACLGVMYQPLYDRLWRGVITDNETRAEKIEKGITIPIVIRPSVKPYAKLSLLASRAHKSLRQEALIKALQPKSVSYQSSFGLKATLILEQKADLFVAWSKRIKMWDTCAPAAIAKAAKATMSFIDGEQLSYKGPISHGKPIMIASFILDEKLLLLLESIGKMHLPPLPKGEGAQNGVVAEKKPTSP